MSNSVTDKVIADKCDYNMTLLANGQGFTELHQLYSKHAKDILEIVKVILCNNYNVICI